MYTLLGRKDVEVYPEIAKHYLTFNKYKAQRALREAHVQELADKMASRLFRYGNLTFAKLNGTNYLMDGQHFCHAVIKSDTTQPAKIEEYLCENESDLAILFRQFEVMRRSQRDFVKAKHMALNITKWPLWISEVIVTTASMEKKFGEEWRFTRLEGGAGVTMGKVATTPGSKYWMTIDKKIDLLESYIQEAEFFYSLVSDTESGAADRGKVSHVARAIIVFMILKTMRLNKNDSKIFWNRVIFGERLTQGKPEYKLREFLKDNVKGFSKRIQFSKPVRNHEVAYKIALAWNAFRKNQPTKLSYRINSHIPELL